MPYVGGALVHGCWLVGGGCVVCFEWGWEGGGCKFSFLIYVGGVMFGKLSLNQLRLVYYI